MSPRARPMAPDDRRRAIVDAVIPLLVREGPDVTTRQIAEAAGIAEGTIFRAFPDKRALIQAAAEAAMAPPQGSAWLTEVDPDLDLPGMVRTVTAAMLEGHDRVMAVLIAIRRLGDCPTPQDAHKHAHSHSGPPEFVVESQRALLDRLTGLFDRYRDELTTDPRRAALLLRALVAGSRHPGFTDGQDLSVDDITSALVAGVSTHAAPRAKKGRR